MRCTTRSSLPIQTSTVGSLNASVICVAWAGVTPVLPAPPSSFVASRAFATSSVPVMCSVSMSPTFSSPTFFESSKNFDGSASAALILFVSTLVRSWCRGHAAAVAARAAVSSTYHESSYWSQRFAVAQQLGLQRERAEVEGDVHVRRLRGAVGDAVHLQRDRLRESAPAAPAAVGTPSILTFSARSSFEGPSDCFRFEKTAASPLPPRRAARRAPWSEPCYRCRHSPPRRARWHRL